MALVEIISWKWCPENQILELSICGPGRNYILQQNGTQMVSWKFNPGIVYLWPCLVEDLDRIDPGYSTREMALVEIISWK